MRLGWPTRCLCLALCSAFITSAESPVEQFEEHLILDSLRDGKVAARFSFETVLSGVAPRNPQSLGEDDESQHHTLFPLALGQILREYAVTELHLTLNAGNWNYQRWGYPGEPNVGTGAELWAWMGESNHTTIEERWGGLRNALAGLFCASLGSLDERRTTSPALSYQPEGDIPAWGVPHRIRHASLPSENVCTENLTPFLKLLPCKSLSGIAMLLNPYRVFDADWHGMGVHVLWHEHEGVVVRLTFQAVFDPMRIRLSKQPDWSLRSLFDRSIDRSCPVAQSSSIRVALPTEGMYRITPEPDSTTKEFAFYNSKNISAPLDVAMTRPGEFQHPLGFEPPITSYSVQRSLNSIGQARGQLSVRIKNHLETTLKLVYLETMPWLVRFYLHTLKIDVDGIPRNEIMSNITYIPEIPHSRPATFHSIVALPPKSTVRIRMEVSKSFLRYTEHPPDAQRGWDLPPAVFTPLLPSNNGSLSDSGRTYTSTLLVDVATPDFSMPYNVIIFTCSLIAFIFGSVFNLLTRKFAVVHLGVDKED